MVRTCSGQRSRRTEGIPGSVIDSSTSLLQSQSTTSSAWRLGSPAGEVVPSALSGARHEVLGAAQSDAYDYGPTEGETELRRQLFDFHGGPGRASAPPEQLLVTSGGMQGLDLACKLFVDPVTLSQSRLRPTRTGPRSSPVTAGVLLEVPTDDHGIDVAALAELAPVKPPEVIYVIPNFQNPSGTRCR